MKLPKLKTWQWAAGGGILLVCILLVVFAWRKRAAAGKADPALQAAVWSLATQPGEVITRSP